MPVVRFKAPHVPRPPPIPCVFRYRWVESRPHDLCERRFPAGVHSSASPHHRRGRNRESAASRDRCVFAAHADLAEAVLVESYDKRWVPASFVEAHDGAYRVGWFSSGYKYECMRRFYRLENAITDYLLFSLGKGRWRPAE